MTYSLIPYFEHKIIKLRVEHIIYPWLSKWYLASEMCLYIALGKPNCYTLIKEICEILIVKGGERNDSKK